MFPFSIKYKREIDPMVLLKRGNEPILNLVKIFVEKNKGRNIVVTEDSVSFDTAFFKWSFDTFAEIRKGVFIIEGDKLVFEFVMLEWLFGPFVIGSFLFSISKAGCPLPGIIFFSIFSH